MKLKCVNSKQVIEGCIAAVPIMIGYIPVALAFGILCKNFNIRLLDSFMFSAAVYAGASQFMALDLIKNGLTIGQIILATFLLNLRHFMMSASLAVKIGVKRRSVLPFLAFGITDETFSVASITKEKPGAAFMLGLEGASYSTWVLGTVAGYLLGNILPEPIQKSMGIGLYAMFAAILVPEIKKSINIFWLTAMSAVLYLVMNNFGLLDKTWRLIATIVLASLLGVIFLKDTEAEDKIEQDVRI